MNKDKKKVIEYFSKKESRWGYSFLLGGVKHFGWYPEGKKISMRTAQYFMIDRLNEFLQLNNGAKVLDAGCGEGKTVLYLTKKYGYDVSGIDLLDFSIKKAQSNAEKLGVNSEKFKVMDYSKLEFGDNSFDAVYTMETLVHAHDLDKTLKEFYRVLRPGGRVVLFEYTMLNLDEMTAQDRNRWNLVIKESGMNSLHLFLHDSFEGILSKQGFKKIKIINNTPNVIPMLKRFYQLAWLPYQFIKFFGLEKKFVNIVSGVWGYDFAKKDLWRHVTVYAEK